MTELFWLGKGEESEKMKTAFLIYLLQFLNQPYAWGGDNPMTGYDCSGAVQEWLGYHGLKPKDDLTSAQLYEYFLENGKIISSGFDIGDLAFYGREKITHVAMFINEKKIIEAAGGNSRTLSLQDAIRDKAFVRIRPYNYRKDLVVVIRPDGIDW